MKPWVDLQHRWWALCHCDWLKVEISLQNTLLFVCLLLRLTFLCMLFVCNCYLLWIVFLCHEPIFLRSVSLFLIDVQNLLHVPCYMCSNMVSQFFLSSSSPKMCIWESPRKPGPQAIMVPLPIHLVLRLEWGQDVSLCLGAHLPI